MPADRRKSSAITDGPNRAPARAMLHAVGFTREDLKKPIIGIANTWTEIGPCNYHLLELAEHVKKGIRDAGGTPMEFNTVSISDGITMGRKACALRWSAAKSSPTPSSWSRAEIFSMAWSPSPAATRRFPEPSWRSPVSMSRR